MDKKQILEKLKIDEQYYGEFGNQFLSNSHVGRLLKDPLQAFKPSGPNPNFLSLQRCCRWRAMLIRT